MVKFENGSNRSVEVTLCCDVDTIIDKFAQYFSTNAQRAEEELRQQYEKMRQKCNGSPSTSDYLFNLKLSRLSAKSWRSSVEKLQVLNFLLEHLLLKRTIKLIFKCSNSYNSFCKLFTNRQFTAQLFFFSHRNALCKTFVLISVCISSVYV